MDPTTLITAAKELKSIYDFVYGRGLVDAVSELSGDLDMSAAKVALENIGNAKDKKSRINSVITHLEGAHSAYLHSLSQYDGMYKLKVGWNVETILTLLQKNMYTCCLMALCYASIGESKPASDWVERAGKPYLELFSGFDQGISGRLKLQVFNAGLLLNPFYWKPWKSNNKRILDDATFLQGFSDRIHNVCGK
jgi:hypothetical protein